MGLACSNVFLSNVGYAAAYSTIHCFLIFVRPMRNLIEFRQRLSCMDM